MEATGSMQVQFSQVSRKRASLLVTPSGLTRRQPPQSVAGGRFQVDRCLGAGCFGEVFRGIDAKTKQVIAVKFEALQAETAQLQQEAAILNLVHQPLRQQGFSACYYFGQEDHYRCLAMEFLGRSLEACLEMCTGKFTPRSSALIGEQLMCRAEYLHSKGIVHRDIKPDNFMCGVKDKIHHLYMIDFGLCKRYFDKAHIPLTSKNSLTGTARYASINAHKGLQQSRRDDLEAIGHMLLFFLRGSLPWSSLVARTTEESNKKICQKKEETPLTELCKGLPEEFRVYVETCRNMDFMEKPDYSFLRRLFLDVRERLGPCEDHEFDWLAHADINVNDLVPLNSWKPQRQPDEVKSFRRAFCLCAGQAPKNN